MPLLSCVNSVLPKAEGSCSTLMSDTLCVLTSMGHIPLFLLLLHNALVPQLVFHTSIQRFPSPDLTFGLCKTLKRKGEMRAQFPVQRLCCSAGFQHAKVSSVALCSHEGTTRIHLKPGRWLGEILHHKVLQEGLEASPCSAHGPVLGISLLPGSQLCWEGLCAAPGRMAAADAAEMAWKKNRGFSKH